MVDSDTESFEVEEIRDRRGGKRGKVFLLNINILQINIFNYL